jgi:uncharacterized protein
MQVVYRGALHVAALVSLAVTALPAQHRGIGQWHGVLATPGGSLTMVFSIRQNADGGFGGDLESIDQNAGQKLALGDVRLTPNRLTFSIPSIGATYEGDWTETEQVWSGVFRQGMALPLALERGTPPALPVVEGLDGTWRATLPRGAANLRLILRVRSGGYGTRVRLDSPDLGAMGLEVEQFARQGDSVRFRVPAGTVEFRGVLATANSVGGTWSREGQPAARVIFARDSSGANARVRTQWPITPNGYRAEDVSFANRADSRVMLAGTLTLPQGRGPFPAVVLISGSGPQDRDETIFGHKPFAVLADHLSRRGIAVLRYDDRGFARSTGDHTSATSADFATDANAAVDYLLGRPEISHGAIGLVGHSEGGMIGPIAAAANERVAFLVLLAGPGTRTDQLLLSQRRLMGLSQGLTSEQLDRAEPVLRDLFRAVRDAPDSAAVVDRMRTLLTSEALAALGAARDQRDLTVAEFSRPWMRYFLRYEPATVLSRLGIPVLALNGSLDHQVPSAENLAAIRVALAKNPHPTVREIPGLNHFFQTARTGAIGEYDGIAETFAPNALAMVSDWILAAMRR